MQPGIYKDLTNDDYHADKDSISRSGLMMFAESPFKYWANYLNPDRPPKETTKAMEFGSAFHMFILEPKLFLETYGIVPPRVYLKDGKLAYEAFKKFIDELEKSEKIPVSNLEFLLLVDMRNSLEKHTEAWELIQNAKYEESYVWSDKETGLLLKARPDILHDNMIVDLKTCVSASSRAYQRALVDGGYHIQGAMIREAVRVITGKDIPNVINVCVEKTYPYEVGIKIISEDALEAGRVKFKQILMDLKECIVTNSWPSYPIETVELPGWY